MKRSKLVSVGFLLIALSACTAQDVLYCRNQGVEGTSEHSKCMHYYQQQEVLFSADRSVCAVDANEVYPAHLYDYGGYARTTLGTGWGGHHGGFYGGQSMRIEPDYRRNNELDRLRMRIIEPCMQARGWVSGSNWQAGRQAVRAKNQPRTRNKPQPVESLPWAR